MDIATLSLLLLAGILLFLVLGVPLGFATGVLGAAIVYLKFGMPGVGIVMQRMYGLCTQYTLIAVPLFIFMASLLERSTIAQDMYDSLNVFLRRLRGGIAVITAIMAIIMAAMSGIIGGEIVLLGLIALPQMLRLGYNQNLAIGTICASGSLGTMIPPSIVLIIYGLVTSTSIHKLFIAAIVPGLLLGVLYIIYIIIRVRLNPALAPPDPNISEDMPTREKLQYLRGIIPPMLLVIVVLGSIYGGITGITEAAGMGVTGVLLIIFLRGELTRKLFGDALRRTFKSVGMIIWITFGATVLAGAYSLAGGPAYVAGIIVGLDVPPIGILLTMMLIFLVLGMFLDWVGIVLLAMPVFLPIVLQLGYDPIWFGILFCINMQVSFLSPPFGGAAFYLKSVAPPHIRLLDIYRSFLPFIAIQIFVLLLVLFFPGIATILL
ncbi:MAG: TRAP transporter large permease [Gammaproteobacteria bacterium]